MSEKLDTNDNNPFLTGKLHTLHQDEKSEKTERLNFVCQKSTIFFSTCFFTHFFKIVVRKQKKNLQVS